MKRIGGIFDKLLERETMEKASKYACSTRKDKGEVAEFLGDKDALISKLIADVRNGTYVVPEYRTFILKERGKERFIADAPLYPSRILDWAICIVVEDYICSKLIGQTYASVPTRGYHGAVRQIYDYVRKDKRIRYALIFDVRKFFNSINRNILKRKLREVIKDQQFLELLDMLIDGYPYDGIPLGNRTSPMLANLYLSDLDHLLKEKYHVHYYVRFMDDCCILGYSKEWLKRILGIVEIELAGLKLSLKENCRIIPVECGIRMLGYVVYPDHILLMRKSKQRLIHAMRKIIRKQKNEKYLLSRHDSGVIASYHGVVSACNGRNLEKKWILPIIEEDNRRRGIVAPND